MIFSSTALFLIILFSVVAVIYYSLHRWYRWQNLLLLVASYVFYCYWDWRFLGLLIGITAVNYGAGWAIFNKYLSKHRLWLVLALLINFLILGFFKYFGFFNESLVDLLSSVGINLDPVSLNIILPLGISFFTFMAATYPFDIYRGNLKPTKNVLNFALFVGFFPTLVSGPVERARHMLPQFQNKRHISPTTINEGIWLIAWGLFQKFVIADSLGLIVNQVFNSYEQYQGLDIIIAIFAYTIQILADFSGYTDIARGVARLLGFDLVLNFNMPYFSLNPAEFWTRWHISLSNWFRDYVYIPLGGNRKGTYRTYLNVITTMTLVGLWHGAAWTFVIWGIYHGLLQVIYRLFGERGRSTDRTIYRWRSVVSVVFRTALMFLLVAAGWAVFRATSFSQAAYLFSHMSFASSDNTLSFLWQLCIFTTPLLLIPAFGFLQYLQSRVQLLEKIPIYIYINAARYNPLARGLVYGVIAVSLLIFSQREIVRFIYQGF
ncbi:MBOAT family O-acyltransferase [Chloroflexota bacterium]